jgi:hypothetical protein
MTVYTDNGEKVTRNYRILITEANGEKYTVTHTNPTFQHLNKGARQTCIGYFDKPQTEDGEK